MSYFPMMWNLGCRLLCGRVRPHRHRVSKGAMHPCWCLVRRRTSVSHSSRHVSMGRVLHLLGQLCNGSPVPLLLAIIDCTLTYVNVCGAPSQSQPSCVRSEGVSPIHSASDPGYSGRPAHSPSPSLHLCQHHLRSARNSSLDSDVWQSPLSMRRRRNSSSDCRQSLLCLLSFRT